MAQDQAGGAVEAGPEATAGLDAAEAPHDAAAGESSGSAAGAPHDAAVAEPSAAAEAWHDEAAGESSGSAGQTCVPERPGGSRATLAAAALATVLLGGFGAWAAAQAHSLDAQTSANLALTDAPATAAVKGQIAEAVKAVFSYSYADTARTRAAAQRLLTGPAIKQYDQLFALVQRQAPAEKLVVATTVTNIGVELMTPDRARLLVFVDQQDTRAGTRQASYAGSMFAVTASYQQGRWKIEDINTFSGG